MTAQITAKPNHIRTVLAAAAAMAALAGAGRALADPVDLQVVDRDTGHVLRVWRHDGRLFVAGKPGDRYSLRVSNHTDGRVLVVMSVDGVNVLTGETAGYDQRGYVFAPYETYDVTGWRKSDSEVAAFTFATSSQSYAARTGRPADIGVIGLAVFNERVETPPPEPEVGADQPYDRDSLAGRNAPRAMQPTPAPPSTMAPAARAAPSPSGSGSAYAEADAMRRNERLGTGHGQREWSQIRTVSFERATSYPTFVSQIEYDTYAHLVQRGVIPPTPIWDHGPRPFPSTPDDQGYVPDPPDEP